MVKRYNIFGPAQCEEIEEYGEWCKADDFKKLQELFLNLHGYVSFHCGSKETNVYLNQYKKLVGEK